ncbi:tetratricopeptide repeat protein [Rickettsia fournieri]|uniref:tetratricopeptide repeat protein n=1 Tax=Rickettsia fournieri TaxID=1436798 RepID=UPI000CDEE87A|nr:tetratricopeptide repeat protein [Rickettsia fournieri]
MNNIKKLALIFTLPLISFHVVLAQSSTKPINTQQQIAQQSTIQDPNILAEEYFNIGKSLYKLGKYEEAIKNFDLVLQEDKQFI